MSNTLKKLTSEFFISLNSAKKTIELFQNGSTVPFVARYRKEVTEGMDDIQLRLFFDRWQYLDDFEKRQTYILSQLSEQNALSPLLKSALLNAETKSQLEDLFAPYKSSKKSKASLAIEKGLQPLADLSWNQWDTFQIKEAQKWCEDHKVMITEEDAYKGVLDILCETLSLHVPLLQETKKSLLHQGIIKSRVMRGKKELGEKFQDYFDFSESIKKIPPHRMMAILRGKKENILKINISFDTEESGFPSFLLQDIPSNNATNNKNSIAKLSPFKRDVLNKAWEEKILPKIESEILANLKDNAESKAIDVFSNNLSDLLMSPPAGQKAVLGVDPGFRNGVKIAVITENGLCVNHAVIYPHPPQNKINHSNHTLLNLIKSNNIDLIAIGNGTASRETDLLIKALIKDNNLTCQSVIISEAGASVYSASPIASKEFPNLDVTIRGAISIARRLQDPLAELVKIEPQAIGVGQYQHDLKNSTLITALKAVVEDCVNRVGVNLNLASSSLLSFVSGLTPRLAENIIEYRNKHGLFTSLQDLKKVSGIGEKCFEQCAGFLRIPTSPYVLDSSGVHPESYHLVERMAKNTNNVVNNLIENANLINKIKQQRHLFSDVDDYTFNDVLSELEKPGLDPRPEFTYANFRQDIHVIDDLKPEMVLEGSITNVAAFGAFVDIGVHQDGLIHISQLSDRFVKDPRELVRVGQIVKVVVLEVDVKRKRISLKALKL
ncbi:helix-hairpin-helix domain-containing protein [Marinomonas sp. 2405UD68-3]|uniref:helix-hairpin-helix domain-containing protein n=1 Tax=Marinomonas sp. 2405UD68-3 TaxID=3391835 RepID=UPI0039C9F86E